MPSRPNLRPRSARSAYQAPPCPYFQTQLASRERARLAVPVRSKLSQSEAKDIDLLLKAGASGRVGSFSTASNWSCSAAAITARPGPTWPAPCATSSPRPA